MIFAEVLLNILLSCYLKYIGSQIELLRYSDAIPYIQTRTGQKISGHLDINPWRKTEYTEKILRLTIFDNLNRKL